MRTQGAPYCTAAPHLLVRLAVRDEGVRPGLAVRREPPPAQAWADAVAPYAVGPQLGARGGAVGRGRESVPGPHVAVGGTHAGAVRSLGRHPWLDLGGEREQKGSVRP